MYEGTYCPPEATSQFSEGSQPELTTTIFREGAELLTKARSPKEFDEARRRFEEVVNIGNPALDYPARQAIVDCDINAGNRGPRTIDDRF